jgi:hypothetical protein
VHKTRLDLLLQGIFLFFSRVVSHVSCQKLQNKGRDGGKTVVRNLQGTFTTTPVVHILTQPHVFSLVHIKNVVDGDEEDEEMEEGGVAN